MTKNSAAIIREHRRTKHQYSSQPTGVETSQDERSDQEAEPHMWSMHDDILQLSVTSATSQLILQPFRRFTYITAHSPTLLLLLLCHKFFTYSPGEPPIFVLKVRKNPEKTSPRKLVPSGDRTWACCMTGAHATACSTVVVWELINNHFLLLSGIQPFISTWIVDISTVKGWDQHMVSLSITWAAFWTPALGRIKVGMSKRLLLAVINLKEKMHIISTTLICRPVFIGALILVCTFHL